MKLALVLGENQNRAVNSGLQKSIDNLEIECFNDIPSLIDTSMKMHKYFDRVIVLSNICSSDVVLQNLHEYWRTTKDTSIVLLCAKSKDEKLANDFMKLFSTTVVTAMLLDSPMMQDIINAVKSPITQLSNDYGMGDFLNAEFEDDGINIATTDNQNNTDNTNQSNQNTKVENKKRKKEKNKKKGKGLFGGILGKNKNNTQQSNQIQQNQQMQPNMQMPNMQMQMPPNMQMPNMQMPPNMQMQPDMQMQLNIQSDVQSQINEQSINNQDYQNQQLVDNNSGSEDIIDLSKPNNSLLGNDEIGAINDTDVAVNLSKTYDSQYNDEIDLDIDNISQSDDSLPQQDDNNINSSLDESLPSFLQDTDNILKINEVNNVSEVENDGLINTENIQDNNEQYISNDEISVEENAEVKKNFDINNDIGWFEDSSDIDLTKNDNYAEKENKVQNMNSQDNNYQPQNNGNSQQYNNMQNVNNGFQQQYNNQAVNYQQNNMQYNNNQQQFSQANNTSQQTNQGNNVDLQKSSKFEIDANFSDVQKEYSNVSQTRTANIIQQEVQDIDFSDINIANDDEQYRQSNESNNVRVITRTVVQNAGNIFSGNTNAINNIYSGRSHKILVVTGDRGSGVTATSICIAKYVANKIPILYFDVDVDNHGLLSYIDYDIFRTYEKTHMEGIKRCRTRNAFFNCVVQYESNFDILTTDYTCDTTDDEIISAQSIVSEYSSEYGLVVVDCPVQKLHLISDLVLTGTSVICVEATKRGFMNFLCQFENCELNTRYKKNMVSTGTMFLTKYNKGTDIKSLIKFVKNLYQPDEVDWMSMPTSPFFGRLDDKFISSIIDG